MRLINRGSESVEIPQKKEECTVTPWTGAGVLSNSYRGLIFETRNATCRGKTRIGSIGKLGNYIASHVHEYRGASLRPAWQCTLYKNTRILASSWVLRIRGHDDYVNEAFCGEVPCVGSREEITLEDWDLPWSHRLPYLEVPSVSSPISYEPPPMLGLSGPAPNHDFHAGAGAIAGTLFVLTGIAGLVAYLVTRFRDRPAKVKKPLQQIQVDDRNYATKNPWCRSLRLRSANLEPTAPPLELLEINK